MTYLPAWPLEITPLMTFGLLLVMGVMGGYLAHRLSWLPSITGFIIVGFVCGPSGFGFLSKETMEGAHILVEIALALILYRLGLSLDIKTLRHSPGLLFTSLVESVATFGLVTYVLFSFDMPITIAALVAAIAVSSSPAVLLHVANEVGAKGEVTETAKTLVALNNLISFAMFSALLPVMHFSSGADWKTVVLSPLFQLFGSLLLALAAAFVLHHIALRTQQAAQYRLALVIGVIMIAIGLAGELKLSTLLVPLAVGVFVKSLEQESIVSDLTFGPSFELFFIVLFVFAGAGLHLYELIMFAPAVFALVLARSLAKGLGVMAMLTLKVKMPVRSGVAGGLLMLPMAGLAIGLVQTSSEFFPEHATSIAAIILGAVTVFETIGPPLAAFAFRFAGEAHEEESDAVALAGIDEPEDPRV